MRLRLLIPLILAVLGVSVPWILVWWHLETVDAASPDWAEARPDVVIVLGGDVFGTRRSEAARLCRRLRISRLWITGGYVPPSLSFPPPSPVQVEKVPLGFESTEEEAAYYVRRLQQERIPSAVVVTSAVHCYRTGLLFRRAIGTLDMRVAVRAAPVCGLDHSLVFFEGIKLMLAFLHLSPPIHGGARTRVKTALAAPDL